MKQLLKTYLKNYQHNPNNMAKDVAEAAFRELREGDLDWDGLRDTTNEIKNRVAKELPTLVTKYNTLASS